MIIRHTCSRLGRSTFVRSTIRASRRWQTTEATSVGARPGDDASIGELAASIEAAVDNSQASPSPSPPVERKKTDADVAAEYLEYQRQSKLFKNIGGDKNPSYAPHELVNNPPHPSDVTLELLLASQSHMGHATSRWNPANAQYIFGIRDGTHIISLDATAAYLRRAARIVHAITARGGLVLFVGTREGQERAVVKAASLAGGYHLFDRWVPGSLTNSSQILGRCRLKVVDEFDEEVRGFDGQLQSLAPLMPDLVVCLNPLENGPLLQECALQNIPTIGVIDTDSNPLAVTYPIPANDDSLRCIAVIAGVLGRAGEEGRKFRLEQAQNGRIIAQSKVQLRSRNTRG